MWIAVGLLAGGALGNLADRVRDGAVTDFIDLPAWPPFNLADVAITAGVALLVLCGYRRGRARRTVSRELGVAHRPPRRLRSRSSTSRPGWSSTRRPSHRGPTLVDELGELLGGGGDPSGPGSSTGSTGTPAG